MKHTHLQMVISVIAQAVDLCAHISEAAAAAACLAAFLPPSVQHCKSTSAADSLVLDTRSEAPPVITAGSSDIISEEIQRSLRN